MENDTKENTTCFYEHQKRMLTCNKKTCKHWNNSSENLNCNIIASNQRGMHTLQQIGDMLNITRMRVCQIEKSVYNKILKKFSAF